MLIARVALAAGLFSTVSQVPLARPSMALFWGGVAVAMLAGIRLIDGARS